MEEERCKSDGHEREFEVIRGWVFSKPPDLEGSSLLGLTSK